MQVTNDWARQLRALTMRDAAPKVLERVQHLYTVIEGSVGRRG